ncbi:MAG: TetR/AcrR family transcriptional regulator [Actinomycetia bacterium]|nr:TetR/AcrR family transcriptional regulator [Actinomycetes bacterium]
MPSQRERHRTSNTGPENGEENTGERICRVALDLFLEHGYHGTSVRQIADRLGVTVPALYYWHPGKDDILAAVVAPFAGAGDELIDRLETLDSTDPSFARTAIGGYFDVVTEHLDVFLFVSTDRAVRSHDLAGHQLAAQADRFLRLLAPDPEDHELLIRAAAAVGAVRRPVRVLPIDRLADRELVVGTALTAFRGKTSEQEQA